MSQVFDLKKISQSKNWTFLVTPIGGDNRYTHALNILFNYLIMDWYATVLANLVTNRSSNEVNKLSSFFVVKYLLLQWRLLLSEMLGFLCFKIIYFFCFNMNVCVAFNSIDKSRVFCVFQAGFLSALPYLAMAIVLFLGGMLADCLRAKRYLTTTLVRKIFNCGGKKHISIDCKMIIFMRYHIIIWQITLIIFFGGGGGGGGGTDGVLDRPTGNPTGLDAKGEPMAPGQ